MKLQLLSNKSKVLNDQKLGPSWRKACDAGIQHGLGFFLVRFPQLPWVRVSVMALVILGDSDHLIIISLNCLQLISITETNWVGI